MMEISIIKIKKVVDGLLNWVRQDLIDNISTPPNSWLHQSFGDVVVDDTSFYEQLKYLIEQDATDQRKLLVRLMYDKERANLPTIHIHYPSEDGTSGDNTLGTGFDSIDTYGNEAKNTYSRSFIGQYDLVITGGNSLEVVMLYEFVDALLIAGADTLTYNFDIFKFSGKQLMANPDMVPFPMFYRAICLTLQCKKIVPSIIRNKRATSVEFDPTFYIDRIGVNLPEASIVISTETSTIPINTIFEVTSLTEYAGDTPHYQWYINLDLVGTDSDTLSLELISTGDYEIRCQLTSSLEYLHQTVVMSNLLTITII